MKILVTLYVLVGVGSLYGAGHQPEQREVVKSGLSDRSWYQQPLIWGIAGLGAFLLYKNHSGVKRVVDKTASKTKKKFINNIALPAYIQYDRIKETGPTKKDIGVLFLFLTSCYGSKKIADHYKVWSSITKKDFSQTRKVLSTDLAFVKEHKVKFGLAAFSIALGILVTQHDASRTMIQRFLWSLTNRQKKVISNSPSLSALIENAPKNPIILNKDEQFKALLEEDQKKLLRNAVQEYQLENDPLSLLDDEDFHE